MDAGLQTWTMIRACTRGDMETAETIRRLVEKEISSISDESLVARIRELFVAPYPVEREWDYGSPGLTYEGVKRTV
jgi:hypothetical protein